MPKLHWRLSNTTATRDESQIGATCVLLGDNCADWFISWYVSTISFLTRRVFTERGDHSDERVSNWTPDGCSNRFISMAVCQPWRNCQVSHTLVNLLRTSCVQITGKNQQHDNVAKRKNVTFRKDALHSIFRCVRLRVACWIGISRSLRCSAMYMGVFPLSIEPPTTPHKSNSCYCQQTCLWYHDCQYTIACQ